MMPLICRPAPSAPASLERPRWVPSGSRVLTSDIGEVVFLTHKKVPAEAILDAEGIWRCPKLPVLNRVLNALYAPERFPDGDRPYGYTALIVVAAWLKGEARM